MPPTALSSSLSISEGTSALASTATILLGVVTLPALLEQLLEPSPEEEQDPELLLAGAGGMHTAMTTP